MRLSEREAFHRKQTGVLTMADAARDRKARELACRKAQEKQQQAAKQAAKGPALPGLEDQ